MRWGACLVAALAMATVETANAQSVANSIAEFGLIGTRDALQRFCRLSKEA
jgi:hypothetical protein